MKIHRCYLCQRQFGSETAYEAHRVKHNYDLWKVSGQTGLMRLDPGEIPADATAKRISADNVSYHCVDPAKLDQRQEKNVWYGGLTPAQRAKVRDLRIARVMEVDPNDDGPEPNMEAETA